MENTMRSPADRFHVIGQAAYGVFIGVVGTVILVLFLSGIMSLDTLLAVIPWIVGFNAAVGGYTLVERLTGRLSRERLWGAAAGLAVSALSAVVINLAAVRYTGGCILYSADLGILLPLGAGLGWLGAVLSGKYRALRRS